MSALALMAVSCSENIAPKATTVNGNMDGCFEVVEQSYPVTKSDNMKSFTVQLKRTNATVPYNAENVSPFAEPTEKTCFLAGFGCTLFDNDAELKSIKAEDMQVDKAQLLKVLNLKPGETGELTITYPADLKATHFELSADFLLQQTGEIVLEGAIGRYAVKNFKVNFNLATEKVNGTYQYATSPAGAYMILEDGTIVPTKEAREKNVYGFLVDEYSQQGLSTGTFNGNLSLKKDGPQEPYYYVAAGQMTAVISFPPKTYDFTLKSAPLNQK